MSWFGSSDPLGELDTKIEEATSESIPNGDLDMAIALEITDVIRSKKIPPKQAMRCLKKRLTIVYMNPNLLLATLKLCDMCVKNGGSAFLAEVNSREFVDYLVDFIFKVHYDVKNYKVFSSEAKFGIGSHILKLIHEWSTFFLNSGLLNYLDKQFTALKNQGYEFPPLDALLVGVGANFIDSQTPPDWIDGKECMICYNPFSMMNRKHHCRACGSVFCLAHSSNSIPLLSLGILQPVRVCDDCYSIHKSTKNDAGTKSRALRNDQRSAETEEEEQIRKAIELSLQDSRVSAAYSPPKQAQQTQQTRPRAESPKEEMDDDLKAAIAASLADYKVNETRLNAQQKSSQVGESYREQPPEDDFYLNLMPAGSQNYQSYDQSSAQAPQSSAPQTYPNYQNAPQTYPNYQNAPARPSATSGYSNPQVSTISDKPIQQDQDTLSEHEENDINLFIQLMNGVRNDPVKKSNILNDRNLADLHTRVVRLKPKVNHSLRDAIHKYEFFLEMNNKISTITRLYDQFLEYKLNQAYGKHEISLSYRRSDSCGLNQLPNQATGISTQYTGQIPNQYGQPSSQYGQSPSQYGQLPNQYGQPSSQYGQPQNQYGQPQNQYGQIPNQSTGKTPDQITGKLPNQFAGQIPNQITSQNPNLATGIQNQMTGNYAGSDIDTSKYLMAPGFTGNPFPGRRSSGMEQHDNVSADHLKQDARKKSGSVGSGSAPYPLDSSSKDSFPQVPQFNFQAPTIPSEPMAYPNFNSSDIGSIPMPSYPPEDSESDAESVASRYPALEERYDADPDEGTKVEHASMRYPTLEDLEDGDSDLKLTLKKSDTRTKIEPEPLIEL